MQLIFQKLVEEFVLPPPKKDGLLLLPTVMLFAGSLLAVMQ